MEDVRTAGPGQSDIIIIYNLLNLLNFESK